VLNDKLFFPSRAVGSRGNRYRTEPESRLTSRERELIQLIAEGSSNKEVASILSISRRAAENHRARIMHKLGLRSVSELVRYAVRQKIVAV